MAVGAFAVAGFYQDGIDFGTVTTYILLLLCGVMILALGLVMAVPWVVTRRQLVIHLVFDLLWCGGVIFLCGGVQGPGTPLIFAVVLTGNLVLPGVLPFLLPGLGSLVLALISVLYVAKNVPFPEVLVTANAHLFVGNEIIGSLLVQVLGLFLVDALGQTLARRQQEQRLVVGDLLDQLGDGVIAIDNRGGLLHCNDEAMRLLGLEGDLLGVALAEVFRHARYEPVRTLLAGRGHRVSQLEGPQGEHLRLRAADLRGRRGRWRGRVLTISDETQQQRLEADVRRTEHLASLVEMAAGIAHEVRNPLASLRGCAQELAEVLEELGQRDGASLAGIIVSESDRLERIVADFMRLTRQPGPNPRVVALREFLQECCNQLKRAMREDPLLLIECSVSDACPDAMVDPDHFRQIVVNLVTNAMQALRGTSEPRIEVTADAGTLPDQRPAVELCVCDNGPGIPDDQQERIFTPFFSTKPQGTGLGLTVVQRLIRSAEGVITLQNRTGGGTDVRVLLPAAEHAEGGSG